LLDGVGAIRIAPAVRLLPDHRSPICGLLQRAETVLITTAIDLLPSNSAIGIELGYPDIELTSTKCVLVNISSGSVIGKMTNILRQKRARAEPMVAPPFLKIRLKTNPYGTILNFLFA
jgi:hypothetical protein